MERSRWDTALAALPQAHVLQTWDWGDFKSRWGWRPTRLVFEDQGQPLAAAQVLRRQLPRTPLSVVYVPKGPALADNENGSILIQVLAILEQQTRKARAIFLKIDPEVWLSNGHEDYPLSSGCATMLKSLRERGWRQSAEQIQFKNTLILDLTPGEDMLLAQMKAKTRYNVQLASRRGVSVRRGTAHDLKNFYDLYYETSQRNEFLIRPPAYYLDLWTQFLEAGRAHILLAEHKDRLIAGLILFVFERTAWYFYGDSSNQSRNLMPNYLLQWEAIRLAKHLRCARYDMWGAPDRFDEEDPMWGVYRFKAGFGAEIKRGLGAFDYSPSPWLYWAYSVAMPRVLNLMRGRHQPRRMWRG